jgi:Tfp pilus assembly protein PilF
MADVSEAIRLDPKVPQAYALRAELYERAGRWNEAIADRRKVLELDPKWEASRGGLKRFGVAP